MKIIPVCAILVIFSIIGISHAQESEYKGIPQKLLGVGSEFDSNGGFGVDYILEGELRDTVKIDPQSNSITFEYDSKGIKEDVLIIFLPSGLIDTPIGVYIDEIQETSAIRNKQGNLTRLIIPVFEDSKEIKIVGTHVIPEFDNTVLIILALTIISTIVIGRSKFPGNFFHSRY